MSKAILVIDMPKSCMECDILDHEVLTCMGMKVHFGNLNNRQPFCPLKPMPKKIPQSLIDEVEEKNLLTNACRYKGYNDCIDEILGKETKDD